MAPLTVKLVGVECIGGAASMEGPMSMQAGAGLWLHRQEAQPFQVM